MTDHIDRSFTTSRRGLVARAAAAGAATLGGTRLTFPPGTVSAQTPEPAGTSDGTGGGYVRPAGNEIVEEASIESLRQSLDQREFSVTELIEASFNRIEAMDEQGPWLNAMIELNPDALDIAAELDNELRDGKRRGPLHGIPVILKDIFATADAMSTSTGSLALAESVATRDAFVVEQMRDAGMVILGKSNMSEWSNYRGMGGPSGWSSRGGQTVNPYITTHTAWGSSTGSSVAVAASYAPVAMGAETDGSIICPASACGVVGLKPTVGLVSRQGTIGISFTQDSPGPIGRSVTDVAHLLGTIAGYDPDDLAHGMMADSSPAAGFAEFPVPDAGTRSYVKTLGTNGLDGVRVGVARGLWGFDPEADFHAENALQAMREAGAEIIDDVYFDSYQYVYEGYGEALVLSTEFSYNFQEFLNNYMPDGPITSMQDVVDFYWEHAEETNFAAEADGLVESLLVSPDAIHDEMYLAQLATNHLYTREQGIDLVMDEQDLDVLVAPSTGIPTELDGGAFLGASTQIPAMAGYPSLTLPVGYTNSLPAGLHMFGRAFSERKLLRYAYALEQTLNIRRAPQYLDSIPWDL